MIDNPLFLALSLAVAAAIGGLLGFFAQQTFRSRQLKSGQKAAEAIVTQAEAERKETLLAAKEEALRIRNQAEAESRERRKEIQNVERRIARKEEQVDKRNETLEKREKGLIEKEKATEARQKEVSDALEQQMAELERVSQMTVDEAREVLLHRVDDEVRIEANRRVRQMEQQVQEEATERAHKILVPVIQRYAADVVAEMTTTVVTLPNDDMKGRLIGREGRNIRALENATGVNLIVDDTPEAVTLSCFDPIRREVARIAVSKLVQDGRIQPARIEEEVERARKEVEEIVAKAGEDAAFEAGVTGLHPELLKVMGRLKFRYSYGQNVLRHSIEVGILAASIASELRANVDIARRGGFLHDIGKALTHEVEGPHALIGAELVERYGVNKRVMIAVGDHHGEMGTNSLDAMIVSAADAISGARPGARRDTAENYIKRLESLEQIANGFEGVERC
jgi:ribonuclease Y